MKILVICASNICRSPYVEYLLRKEIELDEALSRNIEWVKSSAVFNKSKKLHTKARIALLEEGFEENYVDSHKPSYIWFDYKRFKDADVIIGMTKTQKFLLPPTLYKKYMSLSEIAEGKYTKIPDPFLSKTQEEYNLVMTQLKNYVDKYINKLKEKIK